MEKILLKYMFDYIKYHDFFSKYQSGFQPGDSTVRQLLEIYDNIMSILDKGKDTLYFVIFQRH